jgi:hypothetical protein
MRNVLMSVFAVGLVACVPEERIETADGVFVDGVLFQPNLSDSMLPPPMTLTASNLVAGAMLDVTVEGATAGERVYLLLGDETYWCPAFLNGNCLETDGDKRMSATADGAGMASFSLQIPYSMSGATFAIQAVDFQTRDVSNMELRAEGAVSPNSESLDTTNYDDWVYFSFENGVVTLDYCYDFVAHVTNVDFPCDGPTEMFVTGEPSYDPVIAPISDAWDLAFRRYEIKMNGGDNGVAGVQTAFMAGADYASLMEAPTSGYVTDIDLDGDGIVNTASMDPVTFAPLVIEAPLTEWYDYNFITHQLSPKDEIYVVEVPIPDAYGIVGDYCYDFVSHVVNFDFPCDGPPFGNEILVEGESDFYKMAITGYYDSAGVSGNMQFDWNMIDAP